MVKDLDQVYREALEKKNRADTLWKGALASGDLERIRTAMKLCQIADQHLLDEESRRRIRDIDRTIEVEDFSEQNEAAERTRQRYLRWITQILHEHGDFIEFGKKFLRDHTDEIGVEVNFNGKIVAIVERFQL